MKKYITCIILVTALLFTQVQICRAQEISSSASLKKEGSTENFDFRVANLKNYLEKQKSPLAEYAEDFVKLADEYGLDYRLVPAISGVESTFGKRIPQNTYNAYGWANGEYSFGSWENSIETVTSTLRTKYIDKGAVSIDKIARIYAPPSRTWAGNVKFFISKIDPMPVSFDI